MGTYPAKRIGAILGQAWDAAAAAGDAGALVPLRLAFEAHALGTRDRPVLVRGLTGNQVALAEDCFPEAGDVIASGASWVLFRDAGGAGDVRDEGPTMADDALQRALGNNLDMSPAQVALVERAVARSVASLQRKIALALPARQIIEEKK